MIKAILHKHLSWLLIVIAGLVGLGSLSAPSVDPLFNTHTDRSYVHERVSNALSRGNIRAIHMQLIQEADRISFSVHTDWNECAYNLQSEETDLKNAGQRARAFHRETHLYPDEQSTVIQVETGLKKYLRYD